jgi:hypothetical protein
LSNISEQDQCFAEEDEVGALIPENLETSERRQVNTDEHGHLVDPTAEPVPMPPSRLVAQQKNLLSSSSKKRCSDKLQECGLVGRSR